MHSCYSVYVYDSITTFVLHSWMCCSVQQDSAKYSVANHRFTASVVFPLVVDVTASKPTHAHVLVTSVKMARAKILVCIFLVFSLFTFNVTNGDCHVRPELVSSSCRKTASISASASLGYSSSCSDSSYSVTFGCLQFAQSYGGDDKFVVTVMHEDGFNDFQKCPQL